MLKESYQEEFMSTMQKVVKTTLILGFTRFNVLTAFYPSMLTKNDRRNVAAGFCSG